MKKLLTIALLLVSAHTQAGVIHNYTFEVDGAAGSFSYESRPEGRHLGMPFETFDFTWKGANYTAADVLFGAVHLLADGKINADWNTSFFGNACGVGYCGVFSGADEWMFQFASPDAPNYRNFSHGFAGNTQGSIAGTYTLTYLGTKKPVASVTEPFTLGLFGLLMLGVLRCSRQSYRIP